jgi:hypothetical protein
MNSRSSSLGGSVKIATRFEMPPCTRSAASSNPAPYKSTDRTMTSAGVIGLLVTSAHPAARRTGSRTERTAKLANAANAANTIIARLEPGYPTALTTGMPCRVHQTIKQKSRSPGRTGIHDAVRQALLGKRRAVDALRLMPPPPSSGGPPWARRSGPALHADSLIDDPDRGSTGCAYTSRHDRTA